HGSRRGNRDRPLPRPDGPGSVEYPAGTPCAPGTREEGVLRPLLGPGLPGVPRIRVHVGLRQHESSRKEPWASSYSYLTITFSTFAGSRWPDQLPVSFSVSICARCRRPE